MEISHSAPLTDDYVVLIDERITVGEKRKKILGCVNIGGHKLEVGDIIDSCFIGKESNKPARWTVVEIIKRFDFRGKFKNDMTDCGFEAIVEYQ